MATRTQTDPPAPDAGAGALSDDERAELARLRAQNADLLTAQAEQGQVELVKGAVGGTYLVRWGAISVLASADTADKDAPRYVLPKGVKAEAGFAAIPKGSLIAGANPAGDRHLQELSTIGAVAAS
jgi:hypothetical protein